MLHPRLGVEKNFIETGHTIGIVSVQPIGVGITRRCADFFADSNCLFEFSPLFPGPRKSGTARFFFKIGLKLNTYYDSCRM